MRCSIMYSLVLSGHNHHPNNLYLAKWLLGYLIAQLKSGERLSDTNRAGIYYILKKIIDQKVAHKFVFSDLERYARTLLLIKIQ